MTTFRTLGTSAALLALLVATSCSGEPATSTTTTSTQTTAAPAATPAPTPAAAPVADAAAVVRELYAEHAAERSPFFQTTDRARLDKFFEPEVAALIWKDTIDAKGDLGAIDFDPLYNSQDHDVKNLAIGPATVEGNTATVNATFENFGQKQQVPFTLTLVNGAWKIQDISFGEGNTLRSVLNTAAETTTASTTT